MGTPFDALASADFLVPDRDAAVAAVQRALGFGEPKPRWSMGGPGQGFRVTFCRPHPSLQQSPTLVELIEAAELDPGRPLSEVVPNVAGLAQLQGDRPLKSHGTPVASSAVDELVERVRSRGLRHWVQPSSDRYPFRRLWMGITAEDLAGYRAGTDGGLMLEVVDTATLGLPPAAFNPQPPPQPDPPAADPQPPPHPDSQSGGMVRTAARGFLVDDLDRALDELAEVFSWEPELGPERGEDGSRRAVLGFRLPQSARIELLSPARGSRADRDTDRDADSEAGAFLDRYGPGVWHVRIAVRDLDAKADDLRDRGTPFTTARTGFENPETVVRVATAATPGCLFEFGLLG